MELNEQEKSLIEILRYFGFITQYGYVENEFSYFIRAFPSVRFKNKKSNQVLNIIGSDFGCSGSNYSIVIESRRLFSYKAFDISDYYGIFGSSMIKGRNYTLKSQSEFVQKHLIPVLEGKMWVDDLKRK